MRDESRPPVPPRRLPVRAADLPAPRLQLVGKAMRPSGAEVAATRARAAGAAERMPGALMVRIDAVLVALAVASALGVVASPAPGAPPPWRVRARGRRAQTLEVQ